jgi:hypothetical protein
MIGIGDGILVLISLVIVVPRKQIRPPIKLRKLMSPLIELCRTKILTAPPQTTSTALGDKPISIVLKFSVENSRIAYPAKGFPTGQVIERGDGWVVVRYDVKRLLSWFKEKAYCSFDAQDLFRMRLPIMMRLCKMELGLDRMLEGVDVTQHFDEIHSTDNE